MAIGLLTLALETALSIKEFPITVKPVLESTLGIANALLQLVFVLEKLVILHQTLLAARDIHGNPGA